MNNPGPDPIDECTSKVADTYARFQGLTEAIKNFAKDRGMKQTAISDALNAIDDIMKSLREWLAALRAGVIKTGFQPILHAEIEACRITCRSNFKRSKLTSEMNGHFEAIQSNLEHARCLQNKLIAPHLERLQTEHLGISEGYIRRFIEDLRGAKSKAEYESVIARVDELNSKISRISHVLDGEHNAAVLAELRELRNTAYIDDQVRSPKETSFLGMLERVCPALRGYIIEMDCEVRLRKEQPKRQCFEIVADGSADENGDEPLEEAAIEDRLTKLLQARSSRSADTPLIAVKSSSHSAPQYVVELPDVIQRQEKEQEWCMCCC